MDWLLVTSLVAVVVLAGLVVPIVWLVVRRQWLSRRGVAFDCNLRLRTTVPGAGWVLGIARYRHDRLEWYRSFSISLRPRMVFPRRETTVGHQRSPSEIEAVLLFDDQRIIELILGGGESWELSMSADALTGMLSWLEAAPPGQDYVTSPPA